MEIDDVKFSRRIMVGDIAPNGDTIICFEDDPDEETLCIIDNDICVAFVENWNDAIKEDEALQVALNYKSNIISSWVKKCDEKDDLINSLNERIKFIDEHVNSLQNNRDIKQDEIKLLKNAVKQERSDVVEQYAAGLKVGEAVLANQQKVNAELKDMLYQTTRARDAMCASSASMIRLFGSERYLKQQAIARLALFEDVSDLTDERAVSEALLKHQNTLANRYVSVVAHRDELYDCLRTILDAQMPTDDNDEVAAARQLLCNMSDLDKLIQEGLSEE